MDKPNPTRREANSRPMSEVSRMVWLIRCARNLTQAELAALVGVTEKTIYRWESKRTSPRYPVHLLKLQELSREDK